MTQKRENDSIENMGKRIAFLTGYFISSIVVLLILTGILLSTIFSSSDLHKTLIYESDNQKPKYQSLPEDTNVIEASVTSSDGRVAALERFLTNTNHHLNLMRN